MTAAPKQQPVMPVALRSPTENDVNFIFNSWLKTFEMAPATKFIPSKLYFDNHKLVVKKILEKSHVIVAAASDDPDHILGYIAYAELRGTLYIHFVYVKQFYRRMKVATALMNQVFSAVSDEIVYATHATDSFPGLKRKWPMIYNPYSIERFTDEA